MELKYYLDVISYRDWPFMSIENFTFVLLVAFILIIYSGLMRKRPES